jgi:intracellular multiplication protein IcmL
MTDDFAQKNQRIFLLILILTIAGILGLAIAFYMETHQKEPLYYGITKQPNGKITGVTLQPLVAPIISNQALLNWTADAASSLYTYDQANYKTQIQAVIQTYFTKNGGQSFKNALTQTGVLAQLVSEKLEVTAVVENQPAILKYGELSGRQLWKVQLPLLVTYVTASETQQYHFIVTLLIVRIPTWQSPEGLGIEQLWVTKAARV